MEQYTAAPQDPQEIPAFDEISYPPLKSLPQKQRRVGTITMGASLVAAGALLLLNQFDSINMLAILRWSPVILVFLGLEILLSFLFSRGQKIRYDFLSMVVCFLLICGSTICGIVPSFISYERGYNMARFELSDQLEKQVAAAVGTDQIRSLNVSAYGNEDWGAYNGKAPTAGELRESGHYTAYVNLALRGDYADQAAFAAAAEQAAQKIAELDLPLNGLSLSGMRADGSTYMLDLDRWGLTQSAGELEYQISFDEVVVEDGLADETLPEDLADGDGYVDPDDEYVGTEDY